MPLPPQAVGNSQGEADPYLFLFSDWGKPPLNWQRRLFSTTSSKRCNQQNPISWIQICKSTRVIEEDVKLEYFLLIEHEGRKCSIISHEVIQRNWKDWEFLYLLFTGSKSWSRRPKEICREITDCEEPFYSRPFMGEPWFLNGHILIICRWEQGVELWKNVLHTIVCFPDLSVHLWDRNAISHVENLCL